MRPLDGLNFNLSNLNLFSSPSFSFFKSLYVNDEATNFYFENVNSLDEAKGYKQFDKSQLVSKKKASRE